MDWWLLLDNGGTARNSEILNLEISWREKKTSSLLQMRERKRERDRGEQYLKQTPRNTGY